MNFITVPNFDGILHLCNEDRNSLVLSLRAHKFKNPRGINLYFTIMDSPCCMITQKPQRYILTTGGH